MMRVASSLFCASLTIIGVIAIDTESLDAYGVIAIDTESLDAILASSENVVKEAEMLIDKMSPAGPSSLSTTLHSELTPYIIGGTPAEPGRYPYMASLTTGGSHQCGASLITKNILLTAGHCTVRGDGTELIGETIQLGRFEVDTETFVPDADAFEIHVIETQVIHPAYDEPIPGKIHYDFKLIKIYGESKYRPVRLNFDVDIPERHGDPLTLIGWGSTGGDEEKEKENVLREVEVNYVSRAMCETAYDTAVFEEEDPLSVVQVGKESLCHYKRGADTCQGDSGGPVIIKGKSSDEDRQVALTSWGWGCARIGIPAVNMNVASQTSWIKAAVCSLSQPSDDVPEYFGCDNINNANLAGQSDEPGSNLSGDYKRSVAITVQIELDDNPEQIGFIIRRTRDGMIVKDLPIGTYKSSTSKRQVVREVVTISDTDEYKLIVLDNSGHSSANVSIYGRGGTKILSIASPFGRSMEQVFSLGNGKHSIILPWISGIDYAPMTISSGDRIIFNFDKSTRSDDIVQFLDRQHYLDCNYDGAKRVEEIDGRPTYIAKRKGRAYFGCSKHCSTMGHKVEIRSRKGASSLSKSFTNYRGRPCDSNAGRGMRKLRASSLKSCQRHCRLDMDGCNGYQFIKHRRCQISSCTLYRGRPRAALLSVVKPELLDLYSSYSCGASVI